MNIIVKDKSKLKELISEYKYCFSDMIEIVNYFDNNKVINIDLNKYFWYINNVHKFKFCILQDLYLKIKMKHLDMCKKGGRK